MPVKYSGIWVSVQQLHNDNNNDNDNDNDKNNDITLFGHLKNK